MCTISCFPASHKSQVSTSPFTSFHFTQSAPIYFSSFTIHFIQCTNFYFHFFSFHFSLLRASHITQFATCYFSSLCFLFMKVYKLLLPPLLLFLIPPASNNPETAKCYLSFLAMCNCLLISTSNFCHLHPCILHQVTTYSSPHLQFTSSHSTCITPFYFTHNLATNVFHSLLLLITHVHSLSLQEKYTFHTSHII